MLTTDEIVSLKVGDRVKLDLQSTVKNFNIKGLIDGSLGTITFISKAGAPTTANYAAYSGYYFIQAMIKWDNITAEFDSDTCFYYLQPMLCKTNVSHKITTKEHTLYTGLFNVSDKTTLQDII